MFLNEIGFGNNYECIGYVMSLFITLLKQQHQHFFVHTKHVFLLPCLLGRYFSCSWL